MKFFSAVCIMIIIILFIFYSAGRLKCEHVVGVNRSNMFVCIVELP